MKMKWFLSLLVITSPLLLLPGCTLIPQEHSFGEITQISRIQNTLLEKQSYRLLPS